LKGKGLRHDEKKDTLNRSGMEMALGEYTRAGSNASQVAKIAYGGTPISVRVKGHKKKVKLKLILDKVSDKWNDMTKNIDQIEREVDAYLNRLKRRIRKSL